MWTKDLTVELRAILSELPEKLSEALSRHREDPTREPGERSSPQRGGMPAPPDLYHGMVALERLVGGLVPGFHKLSYALRYTLRSLNAVGDVAYGASTASQAMRATRSTTMEPPAGGKQSPTTVQRQEPPPRPPDDRPWRQKPTTAKPLDETVKLYGQKVRVADLPPSVREQINKLTNVPTPKKELPAPVELPETVKVGGATVPTISLDAKTLEFLKADVAQRKASEAPTTPELPTVAKKTTVVDVPRPPTPQAAPLPAQPTPAGERAPSSLPARLAGVSHELPRRFGSPAATPLPRPPIPTPPKDWVGKRLLGAVTRAAEVGGEPGQKVLGRILSGKKFPQFGGEGLPRPPAKGMFGALMDLGGSMLGPFGTSALRIGAAALSNPYIAAAAAATVAATALLTIPPAARAYSTHVVEGLRGLAGLNGQMAAAFAERDVRLLLRDVRIANRVAGTSATLARSNATLNESLTEMDVFWHNIKNRFGIAASGIGQAVTAMATPFFRTGNKTLEYLDKSGSRTEAFARETTLAHIGVFGGMPGMIASLIARYVLANQQQQPTPGGSDPIGQMMEKAGRALPILPAPDIPPLV